MKYLYYVTRRPCSASYWRTEGYRYYGKRARGFRRVDGRPPNRSAERIPDRLQNGCSSIFEEDLRRRHRSQSFNPIVNPIDRSDRIDSPGSSALYYCKIKQSDHADDEHPTPRRLRSGLSFPLPIQAVDRIEAQPPYVRAAHVL